VTQVEHATGRGSSDAPPSFEAEANMNPHLRRWVGLGGLAVVVVLLASIFASPNPPAATAGPAKVAKFVLDHRDGLYLNAYLTSLAVLMATTFLWYLREVVAPATPGRRLANLGFAGSLLFVVGGIFSAGASFALADVATHASPMVLQTLNIFAEDVNGFGGATTALMMGATSLAILRSRALPSWLAYVGLLFAAASFVIADLALPAVGLWLLLTSIVVLVTSGRPGVTGQLDPSI
jgi:hypothetical protein